VIHETDTDRWQKLKDGSKAALSEIYFEMYNSLFSYGIRICKDTSVVKDSIHDLFLYIWTSRESLGKVKSIKAYLMTSLKRDLIRKMARADRQIPLEDSLTYVGISISPEEVIVQDETIAINKTALTNLFNELPHRQREALYLKFFENMDIEEIASVMSLNYQSVANHISRGLKALRSSFTFLRSSA
jgi:RNA polymerase sigma factor (sigma-70 family)